MDDEMFVGEQRFSGEHVVEFMELYKKSLEEKRLEVLIQSGKGGVSKINPGAKFMAAEDDLDEDENRKIEQKNKQSSDEDEDDEDEDEDDEDEEDSEDSEENEESPVAAKKASLTHFEDNRSEVDPRSNTSRGELINKSDTKSMSTTQQQIRPNHKQPSQMEVEDLSEEEGSEEEDDEEEEEDSEEEDNPRIGKVKQLPKIDEQQSSLSVSNRSEVMLMNNASYNNGGKPVEKNNSSMNNMKGDTQTLFNKSKINNSTMKLDFDDREDQMDYRL